MDYYLATLSDGSTALVSESHGPVSLKLAVHPDGVTEVRRDHLKGIDEQRFHELGAQAATHDLHFDPHSGSVTLTPKTSQVQRHDAPAAGAAVQ